MSRKKSMPSMATMPSVVSSSNTAIDEYKNLIDFKDMPYVDKAYLDKVVESINYLNTFVCYLTNGYPLPLYEEKPKRNTNRDIVKFSKEDLRHMPEEFKTLYKKKLIKVYCNKRKDGYYTVQTRAKGLNISGTGTTKEIAIQRFIDNLCRQNENSVPKDIIFDKYAKTYLETVKKPKVKEVTYKSYEDTLKLHILPLFGKRQLKTIGQFEIQKLLNSLCEKENYRTAEMVYILLNSIFDYAVIDDIIKISPMTKIEKPKHETEHGVALSKQEEKALIDGLNGKKAKYAQAYVFILFTGLRRSELASAVIDDEFIKVISAKNRKNKKEKTRLIPITPMLRSVLPLIDLDTIKKLSADSLTKNFKEFCPERHVHELRHTFITRCQECGVRRDIVSLWAGHAADNSITFQVYTHLEQNKELQLTEAQKVKYSLTPEC